MYRGDHNTRSTAIKADFNLSILKQHSKLVKAALTRVYQLFQSSLFKEHVVTLPVNGEKNKQ